ncbi:MAG TPA: RidA family protein [Actinobacteria bacterium]|nr:RidA family protein [Actinomycetota bacterium]
MERRIINPWTWQEQFGFNHGHEVTGAERTLYLAGQVSLDDDGNLVHDGDMAGQINKSIDNIETVLSAADMALSDIVRLTIFTTDVDLLLKNGAGFARFGEAGCQFSQSLIGVARLAFPELLVELEATAVA